MDPDASASVNIDEVFRPQDDPTSDSKSRSRRSYNEALAAYAASRQRVKVRTHHSNRKSQVLEELARARPLLLDKTILGRLGDKGALLFARVESLEKELASIS